MLIGDFNLTINNKSLEKLLQKIRQSSIVFKKPGFLSKKLKTFTSSNYHRFDLIANIKNVWFLHTHFLHFINNSRSKENEKVLKHPFVEISR